MNDLSSDFRNLQVATLANDNVDSEDRSELLFPYLVSVCAGLACVVFACQYGYYWFCKVVLGREDPIDPKELLGGLTEEQRKAALVIAVETGSKAPEPRSSISKQSENDNAGLLLLPSSTADDSSSTVSLSNHVSAAVGCGMKMTGGKTKGKLSHDESGKPKKQEVLNAPLVQEAQMKAKDSMVESSDMQQDQSENKNKTDGIQSHDKPSSDIELGKSRRDSEKSLNILQDQNLVTVDDQDDPTLLQKGNLHREQSLQQSQLNIVCPICLGGYGGSLSTAEEKIFVAKQCGHQFHSECILEWLNTKDAQRNDCPNCRAEVISQDEMVTAALILLTREKKEGKEGLAEDTANVG